MHKAHCALLLAALLGLSPAGWALPAQAGDVTIEGLARSASLMRQMAESCADQFDMDRDMAGRYVAAFTEAGQKAFGKQKFAAVLNREYLRRAQEVQEAGVPDWCRQQRARLLEMGGTPLFRD